jgi:acetylornithine deacetylase/succinyl-diaminopimelate desuccinylase-like protein
VGAAPPATLPSSGVGDADWEDTHEGLVSFLRELIRIPSVNPPDPPGAELEAARYVAAALREAGLRPEVLEPFPGRGSVVARLRGDGTGGEPLLLLSHLDVVPADPSTWTHDPFGGDLADGFVWGRGAVDMKAMVAMEVAVLRLLARRARDAGRDPAQEPVPGLRRDVLFACTADEEAGGLEGAGWLARNRPETLRAAGALNEAGGYSVDVGGRRLYPIQVAEKGFCVYRIRVRGTWGHGSMPREDNAIVLAADVVRRLAMPGPVRLTPVMARYLDAAGRMLPAGIAQALAAVAGDDAQAAEAAAATLGDPAVARALRALVRDTISPGVLRSGLKYNVIPGEAVLEIDCRVLPGTSEADMRAEVDRRLGELGPACEVSLMIAAVPIEAPAETDLYRLMADTIQAHDPEGIPLPAMVPFATDAKHTAILDVPTYGFSPLRLPPGEQFLDRFHGVDERVPVEALRWGLPVLFDVVVQYCS